MTVLTATLTGGTTGSGYKGYSFSDLAPIFGTAAGFLTANNVDGNTFGALVYGFASSHNSSISLDVLYVGTAPADNYITSVAFVGDGGTYNLGTTGLTTSLEIGTAGTYKRWQWRDPGANNVLPVQTSPFTDTTNYTITITTNPVTAAIYAAPLNLAAGNVGLTVALSWDPSQLSPNPTAMLLHMNGTNGSTNIVDDGPNNLTMAANGTAAISTANPKFGTGAGLMSTNTDNITTPCAAAGPLDISTGDWTIEFWYYPGQSGAFSAAEELFEIGMGSAFISGGLFMYLPGSASPTCEIADNASGLAATGSAPNSVTAGVWNHLFLSRQGSRFYYGCNGAAQCINPAAVGYTNPLGWTGGNMKLGQGLWTHTYPGTQFDEVRISKVALYGPGANPISLQYSYTTPTAPFSGSAPPPGYDVYRNGVSLGPYIGSYSYIDTPPGYNTYTYRVAASDGTVDISPQSLPLVWGFGPGTFYLQPKFVPALDFKAIMVANPGYINPRVYEPAVDTTVRIIK